VTSKSSRYNEAEKPSLNWGSDLLTFPPPGCLPTVEEMMPTFELVEEPKPREKPVGLFQEMLQGDPHQLEQLLIDSRATGTAEVASSLLTELQAGTRSYANLSPEEKQALDEATFDALSTPAQPRKIERPFQHVMRKEAEAQDEEEYKETGSTTAPTDLQGLPAFWWT
jgi:hypothetical protein